jgi:hypothetical protein
MTNITTNYYTLDNIGLRVEALERRMNAALSRELDYITWLLEHETDAELAEQLRARKAELERDIPGE